MAQDSQQPRITEPQKGELLLGVRAVLANSFEKIHRTNLVGMGLLPLQLPDGCRPEELGLAPGDTIEIGWDLAPLAPGCEVRRRCIERVMSWIRCAIYGVDEAAMLGRGATGEMNA